MPFFGPIPNTIEVQQMLTAISQPTRMRIVTTIAARPMGVTELAEYVGVSQGTVSYHVQILVEARLVGHARVGLCIDQGGLDRLRGFLARLDEDSRYAQAHSA